MSLPFAAACSTNTKIGDMRGGGPSASSSCDDGVQNGDETDVDCGGPACDAAGKPCALGKACATELDCTEGAYCASLGADGVCLPKLPGGAPCATASQCTTGFCADGVCCDGACDQACQACSAALTGGSDGVCGAAACVTECAGTGDCAPGYACDTSNHCVPGTLQWWPVSIPILPAGAALAGLWTGERGAVYVMASRVSSAPPNIPETWILHRTSSGVWSNPLHLPNSYSNSQGTGVGIWGTGPKDIFVSVAECPSGTSSGCTAKILHASNGVSFTAQTLPSAVGSNTLYQFGGVPNDIYASFGAGVLHYKNGSWSVVYECQVPGEPCQNLAYVGPSEIYMTSCWGYWAWDGSVWARHENGFDFCDVYRMWGLRDGDGVHVYVTGSNNFSNGEKLWKFTQTGAAGVGSWGSKNGYVQSDCNIFNCGGGSGVWGSAANDVWVAASRGGDACAGTGGHMYHYDGSSWTEDTTVGLGVFDPDGVWGTAWDDVWVWASDSTPSGPTAPPQLFHYAYGP